MKVILGAEWAIDGLKSVQILVRVLSFCGVVLQVQSDHYEEFWAPELEKHGYTGVYKKKTGEVRITNADCGGSLSCHLISNWHLGNWRFRKARCLA